MIFKRLRLDVKEGKEKLFSLFEQRLKQPSLTPQLEIDIEIHGKIVGNFSSNILEIKILELKYIDITEQEKKHLPKLKADFAFLDLEEPFLVTKEYSFNIRGKLIDYCSDDDGVSREFEIKNINYIDDQMEFLDELTTNIYSNGTKISWI